MPPLFTPTAAPVGSLAGPLTTAQAYTYRTILERLAGAPDLGRVRGISAELEEQVRRCPNDWLAHLLLGWASQALDSASADEGPANDVGAGTDRAHTRHVRRRAAVGDLPENA